MRWLLRHHCDGSQPVFSAKEDRGQGFKAASIVGLSPFLSFNLFYSFHTEGKLERGVRPSGGEDVTTGLREYSPPSNFPLRIFANLA